MKFKIQLPWLVFSLVITAIFLVVWKNLEPLYDPIADEFPHGKQIVKFTVGDFSLIPFLTVIPLYHAIIAIPMKLFQQLLILHPMRLFSLIVSLPAIPAFVSLYRFYSGERTAGLIARTSQFVFMPILFIMFPLVYTDAFSLGCVLWMIERTLKKHIITAAVLGIIACCVRQTNIVWVAYCLPLWYWHNNGLDFSKQSLGRLYRTMIPFFVVFFAFMVFVALNQGVAIGDTEEHAATFNIAAFHFALLTGFFVFLFRNLAALPDIFALLRRYPWIILVLGGYYILYEYTYFRSHRYNYTQPDFFLRNAVLFYSTEFARLKILAFIPIVWMLLTILAEVWKSEKKVEWGLLIFFSLLSFLPLPLIEQRYYLVGFSLMLMLMRPRKLSLEIMFAVQSVAMSIWVTGKVIQGKMFL